LEFPEARVDKIMESILTKITKVHFLIFLKGCIYFFSVNEPVSGRVRHAAEEVLNLLFKTQTNDSLIDEGSLGEENLG